MILVALPGAVCAELAAMPPCPDCASGLAVVADRLDENGVAVARGVVVTHSADTCPAVEHIPLGVAYFVLPDGQR